MALGKPRIVDSQRMRGLKRIGNIHIPYYQPDKTLTFWEAIYLVLKTSFVIAR